MSTDRINFYRTIHKAIREMLAHLVTRASRASFHDPDDLAELVDDVDDIFELLASHAKTESTFVHPLFADAPVVADRLEGAHHDQLQVLTELRGMLQAATDGEGDRAELGHHFILGLTRFVAEQHEHMADEEELAQPAIWANNDDATLADAYGALLGSIPPAKMQRYMRWMLPALNPEERVELLAHMRETAPPEAFEGTMLLCAEVLTTSQWSRMPEQLRTAVQSRKAG